MFVLSYWPVIVDYIQISHRLNSLPLCLQTPEKRKISRTMCSLRLLFLNNLPSICSAIQEHSSHFYNITLKSGKVGVTQKFSRLLVWEGEGNSWVQTEEKSFHFIREAYSPQWQAWWSRGTREDGFKDGSKFLPSLAGCCWRGSDYAIGKTDLPPGVTISAFYPDNHSTLPLRSRTARGHFLPVLDPHSVQLRGEYNFVWPLTGHCTRTHASKISLLSSFTFQKWKRIYCSSTLSYGYKTSAHALFFPWPACYLVLCSYFAWYITCPGVTSLLGHTVLSLNVTECGTKKHITYTPEYFRLN